MARPTFAPMSAPEMRQVSDGEPQEYPRLTGWRLLLAWILLFSLGWVAVLALLFAAWRLLG